MIACNAHRCGEEYASPGELTAHKILDHASMPSVAFVSARAQFGLSTLAPTWIEPPREITPSHEQMIEKVRARWTPERRREMGARMRAFHAKRRVAHVSR